MSAEPIRHSPVLPKIHRPELHGDSASVRAGLIDRIRELGPWHMDIELTDGLSTGMPYSETAEITDRSQNLGMTLQNYRVNFLERIDQIYPAGLEGKKLLDCACNAGGYSFWAAERNLHGAFGFDAREHWIRQARFVKAQRTMAPTSGIRFGVCEMADLYKWKLDLFELTLFKGIFSHLADPIAGLRSVANLTREVMIVNTPWQVGGQDGYMKFSTENTLRLMSGIDGIKWLPTGPRVVSDILEWLGFADRKLVYSVENKNGIGRLEIVAARQKGTLDQVQADSL